MTTIAYKDGVICCDSGINYSEMSISDAMLKIVNHNGTLFGVSGVQSSMSLFLSWAKKDRPVDKPKIEGDITAMMVDPDGRITLFDKALFPSRLTVPWFSIGSGSQLAMGAMAAGADAQTAVEIAAKYDYYTAGPVYCLSHTIEQPQKVIYSSRLAG